MSERIFDKIFTNQASDIEKRDFYLSLGEDEDAREQYCHLKNIYVLANISKGQYDSINKQSFNQFWNKVQPEKKRNLIPMWFRYAAVFVIAVSIGFFARYMIPSGQKIPVLSQHIVYRSEKGNVSSITLEDGSKIWLSTATQIIIDKNSNEEIVATLNGEAYFDLVPDSTRKFIVDLGYLKVKDIGTKFDIRAYETGNRIFTSLAVGQVDLLSKCDRPLLSMKPGEYVAFNKDNKEITLSTKDASLTTAWKDGKFVFIDNTLEEICDELENWYNVKITIENGTLAKTRYTSVVKRTTTVSHVLKMLALTDNIKYEIKDRKEGSDLIFIR